MVTKDSVQLRVGLTVTASIDEDDASTYLYYHGERPLSDVLNQNVRSFAIAELTKEYSDLNLNAAQTNSVTIYNRLFEDAKAAFKAKGITIQYLGNSEGMTYSDPKVQESINRSYTAQQDYQDRRDGATRREDSQSNHHHDRGSHGGGGQGIVRGQGSQLAPNRIKNPPARSTGKSDHG